MNGFVVGSEDVRVAARGTATRGPGSLDLSGWPLLVHAPGAWGAGVWTEDGKASVAGIMQQAVEMPDVRDLAGHFGTTANHVVQALAYATSASRE